MSEFKLFNDKVQQQFQKLALTGMLFRSNLSGRDLWDLYLSSFEDGDDPVFRDPNSTSHKCNNCANFIRRYGNIVSIQDNGMLITMFGAKDIKAPYAVVANKMNDALIVAGIKGVFVETFAELNKLPYESCKKNNTEFQLGLAKNMKVYSEAEANMYKSVVKRGDIKTFNHFHVKVPTQFIDKSGKSVEAIEAMYRDKYSVFKRAMEEISLDTLNLVQDLINQGSLLDGTAHLHAVKEIISYKVLYDNVNFSKDIACWVATYPMDERVAKFKNTLIGTLCSDLAEGEEINVACKKWNIRVDPVNYNKATAPITKKQIEEAKKFVEDNGYEKSFNRKIAVIDDIKASEIKHINSGDGKLKGISVFDNVKSTSTQHKKSKFDNIEEVTIEKFLEDILPNCTQIEAFVKNSHEDNFVVITTAVDQESKAIFKWPNMYSWTFNGNLAGKSQIKEAVKSAGGKVDGVLRFSINWAEGDWVEDNSDLDAWAKEPSGFEIGFSSYRKPSITPAGGQLDVDITKPYNRAHKNIVENITWPSIDKMKDGTYKFWVNQYSPSNSKGFHAEIEFDNQIYTYTYNKPLPSRSNVQVAEVTLKDGEFTINHKLPCTETSKDIWGMSTNEFHKVNLVCLSPNHWDGNAVGNKHYFFMLDGCKTTSSIRGFHNENLIPDLLQHRKVMEVLGASSMIDPTDKQLAGLGFNSTVRDELIVKCSGSFKRMLKIKF